MERLTNWNYKNTTLDLESCKPYLKLGELEDTFEIMEKMETTPVIWKASDGWLAVEDYTDCKILYNPKDNSINIYGYDEFICSVSMEEYKQTWWLKGDME